MKKWLVLVCLLIVNQAQARDPQSKHCGAEGVWVEILGAGSGELSQDWAGPSYIVWIDDKARLLVDAGASSTTQFAKSGAHLEDLDAIVLGSLEPHLTTSLPAYLAGSIDSTRDRLLPVLGPDGNASQPGTVQFINRLIGAQGAWPNYADLLNKRTKTGYKLTVTEVPTAGKRRWARFGSDNLRLSAIAVSHGNQPALAWRVDAGDVSIVFTGAFSHDKDQLVNFAKGANALVVTHAITEGMRGEWLDRYAPPSKLGEVAAGADVDTLILGHRNNRTRGRESQSREAILKHFTKSLIFANDSECWGFTSSPD